MAQPRLSMRKIRELLRLKFDLGLSIHKIAAYLSIAHSIVKECLTRAESAGVAWPLPERCAMSNWKRSLYPAKPVSYDILPGFLPPST